LGCVAALLLATAYRRFSWQTLKETSLQTLKINCIVFFIAIGAIMFTHLFLKLRGGEFVSDLILAAPGGKWGSFAIIMFLLFILGMLVDWLGIIFVMVPLVTPIGATLGFDSLWFAMMICINLQMSFISPPFAYAIFYLKSIVKPEWRVETSHIIRGVIPFVALVMVGLGLCVAFPELITWLPRQMIKF
ncbi:unnamed protein product, partial [marine sediment metagenome]